ncbi:MAG TPA: DoxX family protein [Longimicrobiaceae bacterium]
MRLHLAEVLLALVFVTGGVLTLRDPRPRADQLARFHLPAPLLLVRLNGAVMVVAGLALALNIMPALASAVLAAVLVPTTILGHAFWTAEGEARQEQQAHFVKNLALLGGLIAMTIAAA